MKQSSGNKTSFPNHTLLTCSRSTSSASFIFFVWICRISRRPVASGIPMSTSLSKRPGEYKLTLNCWFCTAQELQLLPPSDCDVFQKISENDSFGFACGIYQHRRDRPEKEERNFRHIRHLGKVKVTVRPWDYIAQMIAHLFFFWAQFLGK